MIIKIYQDQRGQEPFKKWIKSLRDKKIIARIYKRLKIVKFGNLGDHRSLGSGLLELRLHFGAGYRIYYGQIGQKIILLLAGGAKSSQSKDIKKAKLYWQDYKNYGKN